MSQARTLIFFSLVASGLWIPVPAEAWQSLSASLTGDIVRESESSERGEIAFQDKASPKPTTPSNPPTRPPASPQRPAPRPAPPPPPPSPAQPQPQFNPFVNAQPNQPFLARLSRAPDMFGDSFIPLTATISAFTTDTSGSSRETVLDLPLAGGSRRFKNEHSRAMPTDRVFGTYHHFQNALEATSLTPGFRSTDANVDRFTLGVEKTFADGNASIEFRLPLSVPVSLATQDAMYRTNTVGDLVVTLKGLLYSDESQAVALGLAVNTPTGNDLRVSLPNSGDNGAELTVSNNAVHLVPFLAYQAAPNDDFFFNSFLQVDTPINDNSVQVRNLGPNTVDHRKLTDQTLLYLDTSFGYWLFRDSEAEFLTGLAGLLELHYTTALNSADVVTDRNQFVTFGANSGRLDAVNMTFALHTEIARSTIIRAGYVTPLRDGNHRFFDHEFTLAVIFRR